MTIALLLLNGIVLIDCDIDAAIVVEGGTCAGAGAVGVHGGGGVVVGVFARIRVQVSAELSWT